MGDKIKRFEHVIKRARIPCQCGYNRRVGDVMKNQVFWLVWAVMFYVPMSQVLRFVGFGAAERCYYPLTIGVLMMLKNCIKSKNLGMLLIALLAFRTNQRCLDWVNDQSLSESGAEIGSLKSQINFAGHLMSTDRPRALSLLESVSKKHQNADINYNLGLAYQMSGDNDQADLAYQKCLHHRHTHSYYRLNRAVLLEKSEKCPIEELEKCVAIGPNTRNEIRGHKLCQFNLGRYYVIKKMTKAEEVLLRLTREISDLPVQTQSSAFNLLAESYYQGEDYEKSLKAVDQSLTLNPDHKAAYETRAKLAITMESDFQRDFIRKMDPSRLAHVFATVKTPEQLREVCNSPDHLTLAIVEGCGERARELNELDLALDYFNYVLTKDKLRFLTLVNVGGIHHLRGSFQKAEAYYRAALQINPSSQLVQTNLARVLKQL